LGVVPTASYLDWLGRSPLGDFSAVAVLAASYICHSFATTAAILDAPTGEKTLLFAYVLDMMARLGLVPRPNADWFLSGRLPSVPGALWHQFGSVGFIVGAFSIGLASALARLWYTLQPAPILSIGVYTAAEATLLLTPALFAFELLAFPFALIGFLIFAVIQALLQKTWLAQRVRSEQRNL
jgi:hypothetical protein